MSGGLERVFWQMSAVDQYKSHSELNGLGLPKF
jgi:hypothetical protein